MQPRTEANIPLHIPFPSAVLMKFPRKCITIFLVIFIGTFVPRSIRAESDAREVIGSLIEKDKFDEAKNKVKEYLEENPNDIDALMML